MQLLPPENVCRADLAPDSCATLNVRGWYVQIVGGRYGEGKLSI
jgi:hypothetical protein